MYRTEVLPKFTEEQTDVKFFVHRALLARTQSTNKIVMLRDDGFLIPVVQNEVRLAVLYVEAW